MSMFFGIDNGVPTAALPPRDFAPTSQGDQLQWPKWGQHYETKGEAGEPPDLPEAKRLMELYHEWTTASDERQDEIWQEMLKIYAGQCYTVGLVSGVLQPVAARATLRNVPKEAIFNYEPHGQFGIYLLDTFWYDAVRRWLLLDRLGAQDRHRDLAVGLEHADLAVGGPVEREAALGTLAHAVPLRAVALLPQPPVAAVAQAAGDLDRAVLAERLLRRRAVRQLDLPDLADELALDVLGPERRPPPSSAGTGSPAATIAATPNVASTHRMRSPSPPPAGPRGRPRPCRGYMPAPGRCKQAAARGFPGRPPARRRAGLPGPDPYTHGAAVHVRTPAIAQPPPRSPPPWSCSLRAAKTNRST